MPSSKREEKAERTRDQIYMTAMKLIWAKGFGPTTIKEIVAASGISLGTFYHYFPSKDSILEENFRRADEMFADLLQNGLPQGTARERILAYIERYAVMVRDSGLQWDIELYNPRNKFFVRKGGSMQTCLSELIAEGQKKGEIAADQSAEYICNYLFIAIRGVVFQWCLLDGRPDFVQMLNEYMSRLLDAFLPRSAVPAPHV